MIQDTLYPSADDQIQILVSVSDPIEKKTTLSSYTAYILKGEDKQGNFSSEKRYSDFDHVRTVMVQRWPGCFIPPIPKKKIIGNSQSIFVEQRRHGLNIFVKEVAKLKHLWYSKQFQILIRGSGDIEKQLKSLPIQQTVDIIKRYEQNFAKIQDKSPNTTLLGRVLQFNNYVKKILPALQNFKELALQFLQSRTQNNQQYSILLNFVLPEYQKSCLAAYCNQQTQGKFIFNQHKDERLAELMDKFKKLIEKQEFEKIYRNLQQQQRQMEAFIQTYKIKNQYDEKLKNYKNKQKDLELQLVKLNAGKIGFFGGLTGNIQSKKIKINIELEETKEQIKVYTFMCEFLLILMGQFQIPRFRQQKHNTYYETIKQIALFQLEFTDLRSQICDHILQNHNLM